ncbi:MAG: Fe-S cluster assembly protein SufD [Alphaproteobacteria bacterium]|nr:Fe-S cluster assembly protein SufD [Alphaproteobacteria bacterium]
MTLAAFIDRSRKDKEDWKYTDLNALLFSSFPRKRESIASDSEHKSQLPSNYSDCSADNRARLVFLNGVWQPTLSHFATVPSCILMGDLESGYELTLGEQTCLVAQPIELVFVTDNDAPHEIDLKFFIDIGANGRLTLLENHRASNAITTIETDISLRPHAKFVHGKIVQGGAHLATAKAHVATGGYYNNFSLLRGGMPIRNEIDVILEGEEAQAALNGVMLLRRAEHADTTTHLLHQAPQCASRQVYKTVLDGKSRGVFQGEITVAPDAQKSDGYQLSRALLLSDQAEMDAKPQLEIFADDVKCSHGSAIGCLDEDALFYLRSRGLDEASARALLIKAFVTETLEEIQIEEWRVLFRREIETWTDAQTAREKK